jgi:hypothetical protein
MYAYFMFCFWPMRCSRHTFYLYFALTLNKMLSTILKIVRIFVCNWKLELFNFTLVVLILHSCFMRRISCLLRLSEMLPEMGQKWFKLPYWNTVIASIEMTSNRLFSIIANQSRAFKISRRPPELRRVQGVVKHRPMCFTAPWRVPRGLPPVTLFSTWNINSALLPPL